MKESLPVVIDYWNNVVDEFDSIYTGKDKTGIGKWADRFFRKDIYERRDWTRQRTKNARSVLDIGCGPGRFCSDYVKQGATRVVGMDTAPKMLEKAKQVTAEDGTAHACEWVLGDILQYKSNEQFDATVAMGFWDYIEEPQGHLEAIRRVTKKDGVFLSSWPIMWSWRVPVRIVRLRWMRGCPCFFFTRKGLYELFERSGWKIISCEVVGKIYLVEAKPAK